MKANDFSVLLSLGWVVKHFVVCIFLGGLLTQGTPALAAEEEKVMLNFVGTDIESTAKAISQITGRNFLVDPRVKGTVTIVSSTPIPRSLTYDVFLSSLRLLGFAAVDSNGITKLVPEGDAKFQNAAIENLDQARGDKLVTHVFVLKHESANQLVQILKPMISPNNTIIAFPQSNALVVTDYAENLRRIKKILDAMDQPGNLTPEFIPLKNAAADEVVQTIRSLLGDVTDPNQKLIIIAEPRSNSIMVRTDDATRLSRIKDLAGKLDARTDLPGSVRVVFLKNAEATKMAETLKNIVAMFRSPVAGGVAAVAGQTAVSAPASASSATSPPASTSSATSATSGAAATPSFAASSFAGSGAAFNQNGISIQADASINALIITAPDSIYNNIRAVIEKLDMRRSQVYVEALVVELSSDKAAEFGIQWQNLGGFEAGQAGTVHTVGGTRFGSGGQDIVGTAANLASVGKGLSIGLMKGSVTLPGSNTAITSLGMLARVLEATGGANILSTPNIMTLDNEEAKLSVGQNIPLVTGSYQQTTATPSPFQTIERKDIGLMMRIKPQVSEGGMVKMRIYQEVSSVVSSSDTTLTASQGVTFNKRSVDTNVMVDDGQIIVIGGLIQDNYQDQREQVPVLGDIPLLGGLFRYDTKRHVKTNLMVFIRPVVVKDSAGYGSVTSRNYGGIRDLQEKQVPQNDWLLPAERGAVIPPLTPVPPSSAASGSVRK